MKKRTWIYRFCNMRLRMWLGILLKVIISCENILTQSYISCTVNLHICVWAEEHEQGTCRDHLFLRILWFTCIFLWHDYDMYCTVWEKGFFSTVVREIRSVKSIARQLLNKNKHIPNMCPSVKPNGPKVLGTQKINFAFSVLILVYICTFIHKLGHSNVILSYLCCHI